MKTIFIFQNTPKDKGFLAGIKCTGCLRTLKTIYFMNIDPKETKKVENDLLLTFNLKRCPHCGQYFNADADFSTF